MLAVKFGVATLAILLLILKLAGGFRGFGTGDRIDAAAVTLLLVAAAAPMLDRITKVGTDGIEIELPEDLDAVKRALAGAVSEALEGRTSTEDPAAGFEAAVVDSQPAAQDPMAVVVAARSQLSDTMIALVRQHGTGIVGPSIADNAHRLADQGLISDDLRDALKDLGVRLDTTRRPSPQYAADIADLVHTAVGSVRQQVQERAGR